MRTPATYTDRAQLLINARRGIGDPELIDSVAARDKIIAVLASHAKRRRYAVKLQQKIDRAMESYIRINHTEWEPSATEAERAKFNAAVAKLIKAAREVLAKILELRENNDEAGALQLSMTTEVNKDILQIVELTDRSRQPADDLRKTSEQYMLGLVRDLPVAKWIESVHGIGLPGLALLVAEAAAIDAEAGRVVGLDGYPNPAKLWKRLGYAPFDGHAGSTWKRETWRPRKLTADEWIGAPFSGSRYAVTYTLSLWLVNHQWQAGKNGEEGKPTGHYGRIYFKRREYTNENRPEWTDDHKRKDGLRIAFKAFLVDLWKEWIDSSLSLGHQSSDAQRGRAETTPAGLLADDAHLTVAGGTDKRKKRLGHIMTDAQKVVAETPPAGHSPGDALGTLAGGPKSKRK